MSKKPNKDAIRYLEDLSEIPDNDIDLVTAALALAAAGHGEISLERYFNHINKLCMEVAEYYKDLIITGEQKNAQTMLAALKHVISDKHSYIYDTENLNNLQGSDLIHVINSGKGLPITLCILYMHIAAAQGWEVLGLGVPGYFVCRLDNDGQRLIFDPSDSCKILEAQDLRALVKKLHGQQAELSACYFDPVNKREILIRLQNIIKFSQIEYEDYYGALHTVELMRLIDANEFRLLLEAGVLYARINQSEKAIAMLEDYMKKAPDGHDCSDAVHLLQDLKDSGN